MNISNFKPVFVIGTMRSGTSLLATLLNEFSDIIYCPAELKKIWSNVGKVPMASPITRDSICPQLDSSHKRNGQAKRLLNAFALEMSKYNKGSNKSKYFLNKNPHLCNKLGLVRELFPNSHFIFIYRHLPYVVASLKALFDRIYKQHKIWHYWPKKNRRDYSRCWKIIRKYEPVKSIDTQRCFPGGDITFLAEYWLESNTKISNFTKTLSKAKYINIFQSDLITDAKLQIVRCLNFLNLAPRIPKNLGNNINQKRNDLWQERININELIKLERWILNNQRKIDMLYTGNFYSYA